MNYLFACWTLSSQNVEYSRVPLHIVFHSHNFLHPLKLKRFIGVNIHTWVYIRSTYAAIDILTHAYYPSRIYVLISVYTLSDYVDFFLLFVRDERDLDFGILIYDTSGYKYICQPKELTHDFSCARCSRSVEVLVVFSCVCGGKKENETYVMWLQVCTRSLIAFCAAQYIVFSQRLCDLLNFILLHSPLSFYMSCGFFMP